MKAIVSTKGQAVIPRDVRKWPGIHPGDVVAIKIGRQQIVMEKVVNASRKPKIILAKEKMPIIKMPKDAGALTPEMVKEIAQI